MAQVMAMGNMSIVTITKKQTKDCRLGSSCRGELHSPFLISKYR